MTQILPARLILYATATILTIAGLSNAACAQSSTPPAESQANSEFRRVLFQYYPNYNNFTETDLRSLAPSGIRQLCGYITNKVNGYESLIPQSFVTRFGDDAAAKFVHALSSAAAFQGTPAAYANALLNGGYSRFTEAVIKTDVPVTLTVDNRTIQTTAAALENYAIAAAIIPLVNARRNAETSGTSYAPTKELYVAIPAEARDAILANNSTIPRSVGNSTYGYTITDEIAVAAGYASEMGASNSIAPIKVSINDSRMCESPYIVNRAYRKNSADIDLGDAFVAGMAIARIDKMSDAQFDNYKQGCAVRNR